MKNQEKNFLLFLCGDVMLGRGIDQILPFSCNPILYESYVTDAHDYVLLAEEKNSKINYPVSIDYIWGDAFSIWQQKKPDAKIINLETSITQCNDYWPSKKIHYRLHPGNIDVLKTAGIDICTVANNHVLDWGYEGLRETIATLKKAGIHVSGAGETLSAAIQPAVINLNTDQRILVFSAGTASSGIPSAWLANNKKPGVYYLDELSIKSVHSIARNIAQYKQPNDLTIFSIHWGSNWGYAVPNEFQTFAHALIDKANIDLVFGHSSHHFRPIEIYHNKLILYGCGDFINDYEGISGYGEYRSDLSIMYFAEYKSSRELDKLILVPMQIKNFRLQRANMEDCRWVMNLLNHFKFNVSFHVDQQELIFNKYSKGI